MMNLLLAGVVLTSAMTNLELVENVVADALLPIAEQVADNGVDTVYLTINGEHEGGWLIEQIASGILGDAGITVTTTRIDGEWNLNLRPMELGVTYAQTRRSWILGGKEIPRQASCQIAASLVDPEGNIVLTSREGAVVQSTVSMGDITILESTTERWANGALSEEESGNILEPLVVTGVVTALVYLFYSSSN